MKKVTGDELIEHVHANDWTIFSDEYNEILMHSDKKGNISGATIIDPDTGDLHVYQNIESLVNRYSQYGILYYWIYDQDDVSTITNRLLKCYQSNNITLIDNTIWIVTRSIKIEQENFETVDEFLCIKKNKEHAIWFIDRAISRLLENRGMMLKNYIPEEKSKDTYTKISVGVNSNGNFVYVNHTAKEYKL